MLIKLYATSTKFFVCLFTDPVPEVTGSGVDGWVVRHATTDTPGCHACDHPAGFISLAVQGSPSVTNASPTLLASQIKDTDMVVLYPLSSPSLSTILIAQYVHSGVVKDLCNRLL